MYTPTESRLGRSPHCSQAILTALSSALALALVSPLHAQTTEPLPVGYGATPELPAPKSQAIPTVKRYSALPWKAGTAPVAASGLKVKAFAQGLQNPRWLQVLPNGDVLVAEANTPVRTLSSTNILDVFTGWVQSAFGGSNKTANRITLLRDQDGDGVAETRSVFLSGLNSPIGMALVGDRLYIANTDGVVSVPYAAGATSISAKPTPLTDLPTGLNKRHWTRGLIASADGRKLYASVGSGSNIAENGIAAEDGRAAIWEIDIATGQKQLFATGLRNPVGMAWVPSTSQLWTAVNERDALGNDLVPDYITSVQRGAHYGWPWSYFGANVDARVKPANPDKVAQAVVPDFAVGNHTASLGLAWSGAGNALPAAFQGGMVIGQHGSWNRNPVSGYKVVFVPFGADGKPQQEVVDVLSGFINANRTNGRPVGVAFDGQGALLVADDTGNTVWRVTGQ
jgi:glucose/arabinose dehydrogenase